MKFAERVFDTDQVAWGKIPVGDDQCRFDYNILETCVNETVSKCLTDPNSPMQDLRVETCPTFVVATPALHADGQPSVLRSYGCRGANADKCAIWEAARATSAAPSFFKQIR